jgi:diguanylate cyclase (GGDEF)-like protein
MDLSRYWHLVRDEWVFLLIGFLTTTVVAGTLAYRQPDVYEASGTFVVRPRVIEGEEVVRALDTLNRSIEIVSTYAFIAQSQLIEERAKASLESPGSGLSIGADLVPGTNVVEITVTGAEPDEVAALANAVGDQTVDYIANLQDAFELVPLDPAEVPDGPAGPNRQLTLAFGVVFGVIVGVLMAMLAQIVKEWRQRPSRADITDPYTGVFSEKYFQARFRQEVLRAKRRRRLFSLALVRLVADHETHEAVPTQSVLRQAAMVLQGKVDEHDVLAYLGDGVFALMLQEPDASRAEWLLKQWQRDLESIDFATGESFVHVRVSVGVGSYGHEQATPGTPEEALSGLL